MKEHIEKDRGWSSWGQVRAYAVDQPQMTEQQVVVGSFEDWNKAVLANRSRSTVTMLKLPQKSRIRQVPSRLHQPRIFYVQTSGLAFIACRMSQNFPHKTDAF